VLLLVVLLTTAVSAVPAGTCPPVQISSLRTIVYGAVTVDGTNAAAGTVVEARSPRGDVVGCHVVTSPGSYGMMYVYGEDTSVSPPVPGMRNGETVAFWVDGVTATANPTLTWANDWQTSPPHQVDLAAAGAPPPVAVVVAISRSGNDIVLTWQHRAQNASYQVWRGVTPYFTPAGDGAANIGDGATGNCSNAGGTITCNDTAAIGDPVTNYFYRVRSFNAAGASADSNRVGEFDFALQSGSP
jgi:hypothetical protein